MYLTNVPTLENFAMIQFFSVFGRNLVLTSVLGATNVSRGWQFLKRTPVFRGTAFFLLDPAETLVSLGISAVVINSVGLW